jgi:general secretion pathway protein G
MRQRLRAVRAQRGNDGGFTLTELLIVIVILGVLTGIVVFAVGAFTDRGEEAGCKADLRTVQAAVEAYRAQEDDYPDAGDAGFTQLVAGGYLRAAPDSPAYTITLEADGVVTGALTGDTDCEA